MNAFFRLDGVDWWQTAGWTMIHFLWLGTAAGILAAVLHLVLRRSAPQVRYVAALSNFFVLSALPIAVVVWLVCTGPATQITANGDGGAEIGVGSGVGIQGPGSGMPAGVIDLRGEPALPLASASIAASDVIELSESSGATGFVSALNSDNVVIPNRTPSAATTPESTSNESTGGAIGTPILTLDLLGKYIPYFPWLWIVGTPLTFALLASGFIGTRRLQRASHVIASGPVAEACARLKKSLNVSRHVAVAMCERIAAPVLVGIVRPMILLPPAALSGWSPDEIEMVLLHELAHVRRWDNLVNLCQRVIESLLFFHPAVWLVSGWVRRERETCCDAIVVAQTERPRAYAEMLIALAARMPRSALFSPAAASAMTAGPLRSRIRQILKLEDDPMLVSGKSLLLATLVMLVLVPTTVLYWPSGGRAESALQENAAIEAQAAVNVEATAQREPAAELVPVAPPAAIPLTPSEAVATTTTSQQPERSLLVQVDGKQVEQTSETIAARVDQPADPDELIVEIYDIPAELRQNVSNWLQRPDPNGRRQSRWVNNLQLFLQGKRATHDQLKALTASTAKWRETLANVPDEKSFVREDAAGGTRVRWLSAGLVFGPLSPARMSPFERNEKRTYGVEVVEVIPGSPAAWLNMEVGNVVSNIANFATSNINELLNLSENLLRGFPDQQTVQLALRAGNGQSYNNIDLPLRVSNALDPAGSRSSFGGRGRGRGGTQFGGVQGSGLGTTALESGLGSATGGAFGGATFSEEQTGVGGGTGRGGRAQSARGRGRGRGETGRGRRGGTTRSTNRGTSEGTIELPAEEVGIATASGDVAVGADGGRVPARGLAEEPRNQDSPRIEGAREDAAGIAEWEKLVALTPRVEAEAARMAWEKLGLKLIPASQADLERFGLNGVGPYSQLLKIVGGNLPPGLPVPSFVLSIDSQNSFEMQLLFQIVIDRSPAAVRVFAFDIENRSYVFNTQPPENVLGIRQLPGAAESDATNSSPQPVDSAADSAARPTSVAAVLRPSLRFEGKRFSEWRDAWRTELSAEKRLESVKALAAFGANGYGKEAAEAILEVAKLYDWSQIRAENATPVDLLKAEAAGAFAGKVDGSPSIPWQDWLPLLIRDVLTGNERSTEFARQVFSRFDNRAPLQGNESLVPHLIELSDDKAFSFARISIFNLLARLYAGDIEKEQIERRLAAALLDVDESIRQIAVRTLYPLDDMRGGQIATGFGNGNRLPLVRRPQLMVPSDAAYRPELLAGLKHADETVQWRSMTILRALGPKAAPALPQLLPFVLNQDDSIATEAILTVDAIAATEKSIDDFLSQTIAKGEPAADVERARYLQGLVGALRQAQTSDGGGGSARGRGFGGRGGGRGGGFGGRGQ